MIRSSVLAFLCLAVLGTPLVAAAECYGPVGRNDTLWLIALRLRPDPSISPQRMMLALLEANPEAFDRNNINALYAGSTLCVGPLDSIETDERAAIAEVRRHNREWTSGRAPVGSGSHVPPPAPSGAAAGGEDPARPRRAVAAGTLMPESALSQEQDLGQHGSLRLDRAVAAVESRLSQVEDRIERLESGYRGAGATQIEEDLARLAMRVARIEDRIRVLTAFLETEDEAVEHEAMEPMPTPAPPSHEAMEPMPTPAPRSHEAMEPMPTPAPPSHEAMEPMPTPAPRTHEAMEPMPTPAPPSHEAMEPMPTPAPPSHEAMEPMPTPAPPSHEAMEPMPTPAPRTHEAMEPMPTPAPRTHEAMEPMPTPAPRTHEAMEPMPTPAPPSHEAMEPMPTPAPQTREAAGPEPDPAPEERDFEERLSARVAAWLERVRELLNQ